MNQYLILVEVVPAVYEHGVLAFAAGAPTPIKKFIKGILD